MYMVETTYKQHNIQNIQQNTSGILLASYKVTKDQPTNGMSPPAYFWILKFYYMFLYFRFYYILYLVFDYNSVFISFKYIYNI